MVRDDAAGPKAEDLIALTYGHVVTQHRAAADNSISEIAPTAVPSLTGRVIQSPREGPYVMVGVFSGPGERGRIEYVQTNFEALRDAVLARFEMGPAASVDGTNGDAVGISDSGGVVSR